MTDWLVAFAIATVGACALIAAAAVVAWALS